MAYLPGLKQSVILRSGFEKHLAHSMSHSCHAGCGNWVPRGATEDGSGRDKAKYDRMAGIAKGVGVKLISSEYKVK